MIFSLRIWDFAVTNNRSSKGGCGGCSNGIVSYLLLLEPMFTEMNEAVLGVGPGSRGSW